MNNSINTDNDRLAQYLMCPIRKVISKFGDKWSLLVLYTISESDGGEIRFNALRRHMTDCSQKMLSATLKNLEPGHGAAATGHQGGIVTINR